MDEAGKQFIRELKKEIGTHPEKENIVVDYELHIKEILNEKSVEKEETYEMLITRLGTPVEIAKLWKQEMGITPNKMQWLFVVCNVLIFLGGTIITICYHIFQWDWLQNLWLVLTDAPFLIMFIYVLFWGLLGYEIGREFGHRGNRLLKRTFFISIIPNILLMYLVVFKVLPYEWFQPLLDLPFIVICIVFTCLLYPISYLGYRWGRKASI